jgi:hypothetical protein
VSVPPVVEEFVAAAQAPDFDRMRELVDWRATGIARVLRALSGVDEDDRDRIARSGLDEISRSEEQQDLTQGTLRTLSHQLAGVLGIRRATDAEAAPILKMLSPPAPPQELEPETRAQATSFISHAQSLEQVYIAEGVDRSIPLTLSADRRQVVLATDA